MFPIKIKKKKKTNKPSKPLSQKLKDNVLLGFTLELFLIAAFYIFINIFGGAGFSEIIGANIKLAILLMILNLLILPVILIIYLNHNYSREESPLPTRHKTAAAILLLNALFMPFYWYIFIYKRNKELGLYRKG